MAKIGLVNSVYEAAAKIDFGRKGFATRGKEQEGRISFEDGIAEAMIAFKEASNQMFAATADPQTIILAEYTFLSQELQFCQKDDKDALNSLTKAIQLFDDAFLALEVVEGSGYKFAEKTHPHTKEYRVKGGFPKDSYHIACVSHKTRIKNILRSPGIRPRADCVRVRKSPVKTTAY